MEIIQVKDGMQRVDVAGEVFDLGEAREVETKRGTTRVADAKLRDPSGEIAISLWGDQIDKVADGSEVRISGAQAKTYRGALQLMVGMYTKMDVAGSGDEPPMPKCPTCGFVAQRQDWRFCPLDGEALG